MVVPHNSHVGNVKSGLDPFAVFAGISLVRPSPYVTQASRPAHGGP